MIKDQFFIESLGCAKNSVDAHSMAQLLESSGMKEVDDPEQAEVIIVNTCGFIQPARQESLQVLNEFSSRKAQGQILIAAGCLSELEKYHLLKKVSGLDAALSTRRWLDIVHVVEKARLHQYKPYLYFPETARIIEEGDVRRVAVQGSSAYLKIADGCDRTCRFCAIPAIKGPKVSRSLNEILRDAKSLRDSGVNEVILIAQDSTAYGCDLGIKDGLAFLLEELVKIIPEVPWLRVMYTYPGLISDKLIYIMAEKEQVLPYLDLPLQHAHPDVLRRMGRPNNIEWVERTIRKMRSVIPGISLRTTLIVGFPGETEEEFKFLMDFIKEIRFDHVGIFPYYREKGTPSYNDDGLINEKVKQERLQRLASVQEGISLSINQGFIGKQLDVLIEGNGDGISVGRSYRDAPEIDGLVFFNEKIKPGKIVSAQVTHALTHDLIAKSL